MYIIVLQALYIFMEIISFCINKEDLKNVFNNIKHNDKKSYSCKLVITRMRVKK